MSAKILHIISGDLWGGAEAQAFMQIEAILSLPEGSGLRVSLFNQGLLAERLNSVGIKPFIAEESQGFRSTYQLLRRHIIDEDINVLVTHGYKEAIFAFCLSRSLSIPLVTVFHGLGEKHKYFKQIKSSTYDFIHRVIARFFAKRIVTISDNLAKELGFANLDKQKTIFNCAQIPDDQTPNDKAPSKKQPVFVIVGRLVPIKRVDLAIRAWAIAGKKLGAKLQIIGSGPDEEKLKTLSEELGIDNLIEFLGFRKDAQELISNSDGLLLTSEHEGVPTVVLEAIIRNKPVVSSDLDGVKEIASLVPNFPILFFDYPNYKSAAQAIEDALEKSSQSSEQIISELSLAKKLFSPLRCAKQHIEMYLEIQP